MASLFKQRKPKRIISPASDDPADDEDPGPAVRRPGPAKAKSNLRVAFDPSPDDSSSNLPSENDATLIKPTKSRPSTALQDKLRETSLRERCDEPRPTYSKSFLDELRNSTPSTPLSLTTTTPPTEQQLDITSKFPHTISNGPSHIPTSTEIAAFKARRLRAAHESTAAADDFIPLDDSQLYDSDGEFKPQRLQVGTYIPPSTHTTEKNTRLIPDDEDIMEGFDTFVEDVNPGGRITMDLSHRAERQRLKADKETIRQRIAAAENTDSENSDANSNSSDDAQLHALYEEAQFHAGLDGLGTIHDSHTRQTRRPKQPKIITPIERVSVGVGRLKEQTERIELEKAKLERRKGEIERERRELEGQRVHVQRSLDEASAELERVLGVGAVSGGGVDGGGVVRSNGERGLDSLGTGVESTTGGGSGEDGFGVS